MTNTVEDPQIPLLLLDVDGVINAYAAGRWEDDNLIIDGNRYKVDPDVNGFMIIYDKAVCDRLINLHKAGKIEIRWLTTWRHDANKFISPMLGWPELQVVEDDPEYKEGLRGWWKHPCGLNLIINSGRPVIWIDDDHSYSFMTVMWLKQNRSSYQFKIICPSGKVGLTMDDLDQIEVQLAEWSGS